MLIKTCEECGAVLRTGEEINEGLCADCSADVHDDDDWEDEDEDDSDGFEDE